MTIREASFYIFNHLKPVYGEGEASQLADMVMEHITGSGKTERMLYKNEPILPAEEARVKDYTERLKQQEPVQYILREAWFGNQKFYVDPAVLIPRPETEELVDWIIQDHRTAASPLRILDIGTGSGCIPITLKKNMPNTEVWAIDISVGALLVAQQNADKIGAAVQFQQLDILDKGNWPSLPIFDIIVSNPPYIPEHNKSSMHPNVLEHEPHIALFVPDTDALVFYKAIADFAATHLAPNGQLYFEIHEDLGQAVLEMLTGKGFEAQLKKDMQQKDRMVRSGLAK
ncbi:MAG: peptide chain release factor N(5)-glutamine methyltransferase [Bacteroidetes bacterium]|nr:peptide chain release factor N(5)-glutamine methyltransferase [Bacteroidota bacterium]